MITLETVNENLDFDLHVEAKRETLKKFITQTVKHFTSVNIIPTISQIYDYITEDRWFKVHVYDGARCGVSRKDWECLSIKDFCQNIQNLCSFNLDDTNESLKKYKKV